LPEFAYNNSIHSSIAFSPFYATYGYHPSSLFTTKTTSTISIAKDKI